MERFMTSAVIAGGVFLAGCASGPKLSEMQDKIPALSPDQGRVYFYRENTPLGAAIQPGINLNGKTVGKCKPNGVFFADVPPGAYQASVATEVERTLSFTIERGEEKFVHCYVSFGILIGRGQVELVDPAKARDDMHGLAYTGDNLPKP